MPDVSGIRYAKSNTYCTQLQESNDFEEIFEVVKRSVKDFLNMEKMGLELYLRELPLEVGAFHEMGTNIIVMNRALIDRVVEAQVSFAEMRSFIYNILLHEYLHSLGIYDELKTRRFTYEISKVSLGEKHPATILARKGPWTILDYESTSSDAQWN
jgi:hypothetical protein